MSRSQSFRSVRARSAVRAVIGVAALATLFGATAGLAADATVNEKFADLEPAIKMLREEVGQDRREIVKKNMLLTESESARFWPLYDEYRAARNKIGDRRSRLITDYAANRRSMSEDEAERLTKEAFQIEKDKVELKQEYYKKMSKALSARTAARFFHIDSKLDTAVDAALAANIPLVY
ncbi:MAG TPA: hypothetical protein VKB72_06820 [Steroidobacteraceae bacterium]|nr:hypothetical protein [Steroidobacteraceae bacterium]